MSSAGECIWTCSGPPLASGSSQPARLDELIRRGFFTLLHPPAFEQTRCSSASFPPPSSSLNQFTGQLSLYFSSPSSCRHPRFCTSLSPHHLPHPANRPQCHANPTPSPATAARPPSPPPKPSPPIKRTDTHWGSLPASGAAGYSCSTLACESTARAVR